MDSIDWKFLFTAYEGRINRQLWWIGVGVIFAVSLIINFLIGSEGLVQLLLGILLLLAGLALHIKRCHDRDKSGWWCLLLLIPLVGFIWREEAETRKGAAIATFLDVVVKANEILATSDAAWERIRGLVKPKTDAEFAAIKAFYRKGIPQPWGAAETRSAEKLTHVLTDVGGARLMGGDTKFDPKLFHAAGS